MPIRMPCNALPYLIIGKMVRYLYCNIMINILKRFEFYIMQGRKPACLQARDLKALMC